MDADRLHAERKRRLLARPVEHIDVTAFDGRAVMDSYRNAAFQARNLAEAADIFGEMVEEPDGAVILTLAGSLVSAGLKEALLSLVECGMVDVIVATGAIVVDQDFFEALGFRHYMAPGSPEAPVVGDEELNRLEIDRIYDTYVDEAEMRVCDETVAGVLDGMLARPHSSREVVRELGAYLDRQHGDARSIVLEAYRREVPVFVPALSDSSAGFGVVSHRVRALRTGLPHVAFDSGKDFHELARIKLAAAETGLLMVGGGCRRTSRRTRWWRHGCWRREGRGTSPCTNSPFNSRWPMCAMAASPARPCARPPSWGKVATARERMVYGEATVTLPLLVSDAYHRGAWRGRAARRLGSLFAAEPEGTNRGAATRTTTS